MDRHVVKVGDALEHLETLEPSSVGAVIMDPPYCSGGNNETMKRAAKGQGITSQRLRSGEVEWFAGDNMTTPALVWLLRSVAFRAERLLVNGGSFLCFLDWRMWASLAPALESSGLRLAGMIVWDKGSPGLGTGFKPRHELVAHLTKGAGVFDSLCGANVIEIPEILKVPRVHGSKRIHATEKPVALMERLIEVTTKRLDLVVDPFCGSGSTGVAAARLGRRFFGCDRDPRYVKKALQRILDADRTASAAARSAA